MLMGMLFELISDYRRYKNDKIANGYITKTVHKGKHIAETPSADLKIGDVI
jgi:hypothetical protein